MNTTSTLTTPERKYAAISGERTQLNIAVEGDRYTLKLATRDGGEVVAEFDFGAEFAHFLWGLNFDLSRASSYPSLSAVTIKTPSGETKVNLTESDSREAETFTLDEVREAIKNTAARIGKIHETKRDCEQLIKRLQDSRIRYEGQQYVKGRTAGREWVRSEDGPEYEELKMLDETWHGLNAESNMTPAEQLAFACYLTDPVEIFDTDIPESPDFIRGFADGALEVWRSIKHLV